jgi:uncharacterized protein YdeI (YjbR/CyaY-like superfamily)
MNTSLPGRDAASVGDPPGCTAGERVQVSRPTFFQSPDDLRRWFEANAKQTVELWIGFYKTGSGKRSITWPEAVDEALCFGWIDAVRKGIDEASYTIRFTRRKPNSTWSATNIQRIQELTKLGRMTAEGLQAFDQREEKRSAIYSYEQRGRIELDRGYETELRGNRKAWEFFQAQAPSYQKAARWWVMSAKTEETRRRRLATLIDDSSRGRTVPPLTRRSR